ncbi:MAG: RagB/SusD family nutrient uptake outer membrane protein [Prevotellaceae bacterium]|nr:RagB/SusD family nutrient uptake outer membrane protein [Candidatus Minthosoma caballi]
MWGAMLLTFFTLQSSLFVLSSCSETDSTLVEYVDDNKLNTPNDTIYSLMGIINKMQVIADRTILLGEVRGDLAQMTDAAELDLQDIANFEVKANNPYNNARDYYAIIQNCNYYIANADTTLTKRGEKVFEKELAVVRTYRAWTYMQLALNYGKVPFYTKPILSEKDADPSLYPSYGIEEIADYFIKELAPLVDVKTPSYGVVGDYINSEKFYIPVRVLLGDLCLWAGRYREAAAYYHDFLTDKNDPLPIGINNTVEWTDLDFQSLRSSYASQWYTKNVGENTFAVIPMAETEYEGIRSYLEEIFCSTYDNDGFYQFTRSGAYKELSAAQKYVMVVTDPTTQLRDTISPSPDKIYTDDIMKGDLRLYGYYTLKSRSTTSETQNKYSQVISKFNCENYVALYRLPQIYLRYAEALNCAGIPEAAFAVLKYGICRDNLIRTVKDEDGETMNIDLLSPETRAKAGTLIDFSEYYFTASNTMGIHSRGCGEAGADAAYSIPDLPTLEDSIRFVDDKLCDEMALEMAFEGSRFYDLMRFSLRRSDPQFLARKVASRRGAANFDEVMFTKLSDKKNWYLPLE